MPYQCRICSATAFRKVRRRSVDGEPELYRCAGCGVVFSDPASWRRMQTHQGVPPPAPVPVDDTAAVMRSAFGPPVGTLPSAVVTPRSPEEHRALLEAAARANRSKRKR